MVSISLTIKNNLKFKEKIYKYFWKNNIQTRTIFTKYFKTTCNERFKTQFKKDAGNNSNYVMKNGIL